MTNLAVQNATQARPQPSVYLRAQRVDPTRTKMLRDSFEREIRRRFARLKLAIKAAVVDQDCFGLVQDPRIIGRLVTQAEPQPPTHRQFDFPTVQQKKDGFIAWLQEQEQLGLLETTRIPQFGQAIEEAWTDVFIKDSYARGVQRARYEMGQAGYLVPTLEATGGLVASMSLPVHVDRLGVVYSRAFDQLKGITSAMDSQISHILAQGLADGDNPITLARKLLATIDGQGAGTLGITDSLGRFVPAERRARMLARTEIIRAHAQGSLAEFKMWAVAGVELEAEWVTAGFFNVCPLCQELAREGPYTIEQAMNMLPAHPNCRCAWVPRPVEKIKVFSNPCHNPAGPGGGQFCSGSGGNTQAESADYFSNEAFQASSMRWAREHYFGTPASTALNSWLRGSNFYQDSQMQPILNRMDQTFREASVTIEKSTLYRGISGRAAEDFVKMDRRGRAQLKVGDTIKDKGFVSTTTDSKYANNFSTIGWGLKISIEVPSGTSVLKHPKEKEVLLNRGLSFRVKKIDINPDGPGSKLTLELLS